MNTEVNAQRRPGSNQVLVRTKTGETLYRRMWGGIAWPALKYGYSCIVGEVEPDAENVPFGELRLLDEVKGESIDELYDNTVSIKDIWCVTRFYVDGSNEDLKDRFTLADGLCRYRPPYKKIKEKYPYFKNRHITAFLDDAPQVGNLEYGVRLIIDWFKGRKLKVAKEIKSFTKVLPITEQILKQGLTPELNASRFVLAAYDSNPIYYRETGEGSVRFTNFAGRNKKGTGWGSGYKEIFIDE
jgi:hypothetical protein